MSKIKIKVSQNNIDKGIPESYDSCPIARAIKEIFPGSKVRVEGFNIKIGAINYDCTESARRFIGRFDEKKAVKPSTFIFRNND